MKGREILLGELVGRKVAALMVDGRLDDLLVEPPADLPIVGAIYRAVADRPMKGQGGVMVRLSDGLTGFLRQAKGVRPGQRLLVQVTGHAETGKAVPVTQRLLFKSRACIVTPGAPGINLSRQLRDEEQRTRLLELVHDLSLPEGCGLIVRTAAEALTDEEVSSEITETVDLAQKVMGDEEGAGPELLLDGPDPEALAWREWSQDVRAATIIDARAMDRSGLAEAVEALRDARVDLTGGGFLFVEPTRALVAVDVNTGADTSPAAGLKVNLAAARELPRALRLRGLGGQVTIDFAPMPKVERKRVEQALNTAFRTDPIETSLVGWTPSGHFEIQRKRERMPLWECLP